MRTETIEIKDAQAQFTEIVHRVVAGLHVIVSEDQKPLVHLIPAGKRVAGLHAGAASASDDFDAPLADEFWCGAK